MSKTITLFISDAVYEKLTTFMCLRKVTGYDLGVDYELLLLIMQGIEEGSSSVSIDLSEEDKPP